jgi:hypothetical protein
VLRVCNSTAHELVTLSDALSYSRKGHPRYSGGITITGWGLWRFGGGFCARPKKRAAQAKDLSAKKAFEEVARGSLVLAEQIEWIDRQTLRDEENDR